MSFWRQRLDFSGAVVFCLQEAGVSADSSVHVLGIHLACGSAHPRVLSYYLRFTVAWKRRFSGVYEKTLLFSIFEKPQSY